MTCTKSMVAVEARSKVSHHAVDIKFECCPSFSALDSIAFKHGNT